MYYPESRNIEVSELKIELRKSEDLNEKWKERANQLMDRVIDSKRKVLFIIDEFPDMLTCMLGNSPEDHESFLHWFRKIRERSLKSNLRWLLGGSVNLVAVLDQIGKVKLINDLKIEPLPPFSQDEVNQFVTAMFQENWVEFDETAVPRIIELLGSPIPLFLQMLVQELYRQWKRNHSESDFGKHRHRSVQKDTAR